jgi:predicted double-glycine peptidase
MKGLLILLSLYFLPLIDNEVKALDLNGLAGGGNFNGTAGGGNFHIPITSFKGRRFKTVYKQQYDFSCGSSALASLLSFHYEDIVNEQSVFKDMYENGNQDTIQKKGFSLLDMKLYLNRRGYRYDCFKINLDQLIDANVPAITIIDNKGYLHFIIIKGITKKEVLVGDPALGVKVIPREKFEEMWGRRILFFIYDKQDIAGNHFQNKSEWEVIVKADLKAVVNRSSLSSFNLLQPIVNDF